MGGHKAGRWQSPPAGQPEALTGHLWKGLRGSALGQLFPLINFLLEEEPLEKRQEDS